MKYVLPAIALLTLAISVQARKGNMELCKPPSSHPKADHSVSAPGVTLQVAASLHPESKSEMDPPNALPTSLGDSLVQGNPKVDDEGLAREILETLSGLELSKEQWVGILAVLQERSEELRLWHQEIRSSGVFNPSEYSRGVLQRKELWFRRIDGLLNARQHEGFRELVTTQSVLRPGTDFTVYSGELTVIR